VALNFLIITQTSQKSQPVEWLEIETPLGNMVIEQGHAPLITSLKEGCEILFKPVADSVKSIKINRGIAKIKRDSATVLVDSDE